MSFICGTLKMALIPEFLFYLYPFLTTYFPCLCIALEKLQYLINFLSLLFNKIIKNPYLLSNLYRIKHLESICIYVYEIKKIYIYIYIYILRVFFLCYIKREILNGIIEQNCVNFRQLYFQYTKK